MPLAATPEDTRFFHDWLDRFARMVRDVDYAPARPMFDDAVLAFGTHMDIVEGLGPYERQQWHSVWPTIDGFAFRLDLVRIGLSDDRSMAFVMAPWTSTGYHRDGSAYPRPGRATLVFGRRGGAWKVIHSHMSLNPGTPGPSHKAKPPKSI